MSRLSDAFQKAINLPTGTYKTVRQSGLRESNTMIVAAYQEAITNAASIYPIIGTVGLSPCICLIAYNPETKTAALAHDPLATGIAQAIFNETLSKVRTAPAQLVRIHVIGSFLNSERKGLDTHAKDALEALALEIEQTPNVKLVNV